MNISATISYPASTSPAQVYELSTDPDFRAAVCEATHALDYDVHIDEHDDGTSRVVVSRTMPADVPDFMKKLIGETVGVVQTEDWSAPGDDGQRTADLVLEIKGQPAKMVGTAAIVVTGTAVETRIEGNLKVSIPFVGKKIEAEVAKGIYAAIRREQETAASRLS
ncbi:MAG: DUF2505 domain-containing protein [Nocardioidaceae bacterium]